MKRISFFVFTIIIISELFIFTSCSKKYNSLNTFAESGFAPVQPRAMKQSVATVSQTMAMDFEEDSVEYEELSSEDAPSPLPRKLIKTGNINIETESLTDIDQKIFDFAKGFGGYVTNSSAYESGFNATVKIPEDRFDSAMSVAGNFGKIKYQSVNSDDVTEEFYDLKTRLETKKIMQKKLEDYLSQAKNLSDLLEVERQLNNVTSEIESMEGRMKRLNNQINFSTIHINLNLPAGYNNAGFKWPDFGENFREFGVNIVNFFSKLLMIMLYLVIFGIPVVGLIALLFWLLFGKIGLLKKLFNKLK